MSHIDATLAHSARDAYVLHGHCIHELCRFLYEKGEGKGIESHRRHPLTLGKRCSCAPRQLYHEPCSFFCEKGKKKHEPLNATLLHCRQEMLMCSTAMVFMNSVVFSVKRKKKGKSHMNVTNAYSTKAPDVLRCNGYSRTASFSWKKKGTSHVRQACNPLPFVFTNWVVCSEKGTHSLPESCCMHMG